MLKDRNLIGARVGKFKRGQIVYMMVFALPVLTAVTIYVMDLGNFWMNIHNIQKAADGASLAGANYLPTSPDAARTAAINFATANLTDCPAVAGGSSCKGSSTWTNLPGLDGNTNVAANVSSDKLSITVSITRTLPYYLAPFLRALGVDSGTAMTGTKTISSKSVATLQAIAGARGLLPLGIDYSVLTQVGHDAGTTYSVTLAQVGQTFPLGLGSNNLVWDAIVYPTELPGGLTTLLSDIQSGYSGLMTIGQDVYSTNSATASAVAQQIQSRISFGAGLYPTGTAADHVVTDPRAVVVPIVSVNAQTPLGHAQINGFAELWLNGTEAGGNVDVKFINQVTPGSQLLHRNLVSADLGVYQPVLAQ